MTTLGDMSARLTKKIGRPSPDVLSPEDRLAAVKTALREHSAGCPRHVIADVTTGLPMTSWALPSGVTDDTVIVEIESPVDVTPKAYMEPDLRWRHVRTSTGHKVVFAGTASAAFRVVYTQPWLETDADLAFMSQQEAEAVASLAAHHAALAIAAVYAHLIQGPSGSAGDIADAGKALDVWAKLAETYRAEYVKMLRGDEDDPRGPVVVTSEAAMRRLGYPHRRIMPRGSIWFRGGAV